MGIEWESESLPISPALSVREDGGWDCAEAEVLEQRRRILGVRRENPSGGLIREEVKLHPIKSLGEEAEQETRVRLSIFYSLSLQWRAGWEDDEEDERTLWFKLQCVPFKARDFELCFGVGSSAVKCTGTSQVASYITVKIATLKLIQGCKKLLRDYSKKLPP